MLQDRAGQTMIITKNYYTVVCLESYVEGRGWVYVQVVVLLMSDTTATRWLQPLRPVGYLGLNPV